MCVVSGTVPDLESFFSHFFFLILKTATVGVLKRKGVG